jgi:V8-like Glu-specific endopeptidase
MMKLDEIKQQQAVQAQSIQELSARSSSIIDVQTRELVSAAVCLLSVTESFHPIGVCFFVSKHRAVTCCHNVTLKRLRSFVWCRSNSDVLRLRLVFKSNDDDYAILDLEQGDAPAFLEPTDDKPEIGAQFILASYSIGIMEHIKDEFKLSISVSSAQINKVSANHVVYQAPTYAGDSGSALVLLGGKVFGIHLASVNQANERLRVQGAKERMTAAEASIDQLIQGTAQGAVGLLAHVFMPKIIE